MTKWRKSTYSTTGQSDCVEMAALPDGLVGVRDSKAPHAGHLTLSRRAVAGIMETLKTRVDQSQA